jgi:predicted ArsR family transcriptional regulator
MSGIPRSSKELGPIAQQLLAYLRDHPNQQFGVEQMAQAIGCSIEEAQTHLEALAYQGEIEKVRPDGGATVYTRPKQT